MFRRVNTKVVIDIATGSVLERESYPYRGPWALATNPTSVLRASGESYILNSFSTTTSAVDLSGLDVNGNGMGAGLRHDGQTRVAQRPVVIPTGVTPDFPYYQTASWVGGQIVGNVLEDGTLVLAYFAPADWSEVQANLFDSTAPLPPPAPGFSISPLLMRMARAGRKRELGEGLVLKQIFPSPPPPPSIYSRQIRMARAQRKREPGAGEVWKQTFPPPILENVLRRMFRLVFSPRRREAAHVSRWQTFAPPVIAPSENIFTRFLRISPGRRRRIAPHFRRVWQMLLAPPVSALLKRVAGWFRPFWRI